MTIKFGTNYLDQHEKRKEGKGKHQKETGPVSTFRKRERCELKFGKQGKVHVRYHRDKILMLSDADGVSYNGRLYLRSYRKT